MKYSIVIPCFNEEEPILLILERTKNPFLDKNNGLMRADVFFIVPTLFTDKRNKNWNSDVYDNDFTNTMMESTIKYQSTAWLDSGNLYSPNYRQAHYKVFDEFRWENGGKRAFELAYEDIKRSFEVYLNYYCRTQSRFRTCNKAFARLF